MVGNSFLTVVKFVVFGLTGSGSMLAEAIHSAADSGNQALIFVGIKRSMRRPDAMFPYGYGVDRYFYSLLSAVGIFVLGCGVTLYHGVHNLLNPHPITHGWPTWAVLAISFVVDCFVLIQVIRQLKDAMAAQGISAYIKNSTDPTAIAVLFEDLVACLGVLVAAAGIGLSSWLESSVPDAIGTIIIGLMMGAVAVWMGLKNRSLIVGQAAPEGDRAEILAFLREQEIVESIHDVRSRVLGAEALKIKADVDFDGRVLGRRLVPWVKEHLPPTGDEAALTPFAEGFGEQVMEALGDEVDRIEEALVERFPQVKVIDLEAE